MYRLLFIAVAIFLHSLLLSNEAIAKRQGLRIAVIGAHNPEYDHIGKYSHLNKQAYAQKQGYDVHLYTEYLQPSENLEWWNKWLAMGERMQRFLGYWYKVIAVQKHLAEYDWLLYLDSDALIMNDMIKLEDLIDDRYDLIASNDGGTTPILSGQFLIKNSKWSKKFLKNWLAIGNNNIQPGFDGGALIQLFNENPDMQKHIKLIPIRKLGSYSWDYQEGDFAIQFAGMTHDEKERCMREYYEKTLSIETR